MNGESGPLDYGDARERFEELGWVTRENVFGCYRYERVAQPGNQVGIAFVCHAWTDIDDDDQVAHWTKTARWDVEIETFRGSAVNGEGDEF